MIQDSPIHFRRRRGAFTLVEVMISVALVLMIIYGVAQVFKMTSDAIGANQAIASMSRDNRAAQATLAEDFRNCVFDSPVFLLSSRVAYNGTAANNSVTLTGHPAPYYRGMRGSYLNAADERENPTSPATSVSPAALSDRNPRLDRLGFFARGQFRRQTANDNSAYNSASSGEAYVWYGHTVLPDSLGQKPLQPNDQYASERILGRMCYLLKDVSTMGPTTGSYYPTSQDLTKDPLGWLSWYTQASKSPQNATIGRWDLASCTIEQFRNAVNKTILTTNSQFWYQPMEDQPATVAPAQPADKIFRVQCDSRLPRPLNAASIANTVPYFVGSCSQFVVEYAGDFLNQDPTDGTVLGVSKWVGTDGLHSDKTDGQLDFIIDKPLGTETPTPDHIKQWSKRIRWYGLPREVTGDNLINSWDVIPLRDVVFNTPGAAFPVAKFIRALWEAEYPDPNYSNNYLLYPVNAGTFRYVCAWNNDAPRLIRVSFKINDPSGRLQEGQWYEYILSR